MELLLVFRNYGRTHTTEIQYESDMVREWRDDADKWRKRLADEQAGRIRDDSPILIDVLEIP